MIFTIEVNHHFPPDDKVLSSLARIEQQLAVLTQGLIHDEQARLLLEKVRAKTASLEEATKQLGS